MATATPVKGPLPEVDPDGAIDFDFPRFKEYAGPGYEWGATVSDIDDRQRNSKVTQTWSASFCTRPSGYHVRGPALYWTKEWAEKQNFKDPMDLPRFDEDKWHKLFATVNSRSLRIYKTQARRSPECVYRHVFPTEEDLYCVTWVYNADGKRQWWLVCGGAMRVIWVINAVTKQPVRRLVAHGEAIYDLQVHPRDPALLISASKDESLRLWNLRTGAQIALFAGLKGHHGEVVTVDWDRLGSRFASCSIDNSIRIWNVASDKLITDAIVQSHDAADRDVDKHGYYIDSHGVRRRTDVVICQEPAFVTRKIHKHYVDCCAFVGEAIISKSLHNMLYLWLPGADRHALASVSQDYTLQQEYPVTNTDVWFIRFGMCTKKQTLAIGGRNGMVSVFYLKEFTPKRIDLRPHKKLPDDTYIRKCVFSDDAKVIIAVGDDARVYQYDRADVPKYNSNNNREATASASRRSRKNKKSRSRKNSSIGATRANGNNKNNSNNSTPTRNASNNNNRSANGARSSPRNNNNISRQRAAAVHPDQLAMTRNNGNAPGRTQYSSIDIGSSDSDGETRRNNNNSNSNSNSGILANRMEEMDISRPNAGYDAQEQQSDATPARATIESQADNNNNNDEEVVAVEEEEGRSGRRSDNSNSNKEDPEVIVISD